MLLSLGTIWKYEPWLFPRVVRLVTGKDAIFVPRQTVDAYDITKRDHWTEIQRPLPSPRNFCQNAILKILSYPTEVLKCDRLYFFIFHTERTYKIFEIRFSALLKTALNNRIDVHNSTDFNSTWKIVCSRVLDGV